MGAITYAGKKPKRFKWTKRIIIALALYTIVGFFVVPAIIKSQMLKRLPALTHRNATVEQVKFNPYALSLTIRGFALKETNGDVFSSFDEFYINFQPIASLFKRTWVFSDISLQKPYAQIIYRPDGTFNFANLIPTNSPASNSPPPSPGITGTLPRVTIYNLSISNGLVSLNDLNRKDPFHKDFNQTLNFTNLTTVRDKNSPYSFIMHTGSGESFGWSGNVTVNPLRSSGVFRIGGLKLPEYATYAHDYARYDIVGGSLDIAAAYRYDSATNALDLSVSNLLVALHDLILTAPDHSETNISIPSFEISGTDASVARQTAHVGLIKSSGGSLVVRRDADGSINLLSLINFPANSSPAPASAETNAPPSPLSPAAWSARIDDIAFDDYSITAEDKQLIRPATFKIDQLGFDVKNVSNASNAPVTVSLSLRFAKTGTIAVNGAATLLPPSADVQLSLSNVDLRPIQPYVEEQATLAITGGAVDLDGRARYVSDAPGAPLINFTGSVAVDKFDVVDDVLFKDFAKWDALEVSNIDLNMLPNSLQVGTVEFDKLVTSVVLGSNRLPTFLTLVRKSPGAATATNTASANASTEPIPAAALAQLPPVSIGAIVLKDCSVPYLDQFIEPNCDFGVQQFSGVISNISLSGRTMATVDVHGQVDERSPFSAVGKIIPDLANPFADITVVFTNTELTPLSPYSGKYVGRPLDKGKLSFAVHYLVDNKTLKAENSFYVDQLTLGAKNDSPDATSLPVKLAIALLKDRNGRIELDVPLSGRTDDPKFKVGPVIWTVVRNLLEKAATSPFSLLGAAFGGGDELSFVSFEPGLSDIPDSETNKLQTLAKALYSRPALELDITGSVDPVRDRFPLQLVKLDDQLKALFVQERREAGKSAIAVDQVQLDPAEHERLLRKLYKTRIGSYVPTPVTTNQASGSGSDAARVAALLAALPPAPPIEHGAELLSGKRNKATGTKPASGTAPKTSSNGTAKPGGPPLTRAQLELEDMTDQLASKIDVTGDDFNSLMQKRANHVQSYLLQTGKVTADRLFVITPKPANGSSGGSDRANLSLE